jgi:hypothetical protein
MTNEDNDIEKLKEWMYRSSEQLKFLTEKVSIIEKKVNEIAENMVLLEDIDKKVFKLMTTVVTGNGEKPLTSRLETIEAWVIENKKREIEKEKEEKELRKERVRNRIKIIVALVAAGGAIFLEFLKYLLGH